MTSVHDMTLARIAGIHPQASCKGFASRVRKVFADNGDAANPIDFVPGLFWFDEGDGRDCDSGTITCVEIEDHHPVGADKLRSYCQLWFDLDSVNCELRLLTCDRWGRKLTPVPLQEYHWAARDEKPAARRRAADEAA